MTHLDQSIAARVTFGITTTGNVQALQMALSSVLMGHILPARILLRFEGQFPAFANFYLEQLSELARVRGVEFSLNVAKSSGVRAARDWLLDNCATEYLWMGDDDAIYMPHCLAEFHDAIMGLESSLRADEFWGYVVGTKPDLNNRRGYQDFSTEPRDAETAENHSSFNQFYKGKGTTVLHHHLDTGNVVFNVRKLRVAGIRFSVYEKSYNAGGEDTLFALMSNKAGLQGYFRTRADAIHLEKPEIRFNEFAARKTMLLRDCQIQGIDPAEVQDMMPWVK